MSESSTTFDVTGHRVADPSLVTYTHIIYGLHALSVLIGLTGPATVVGSFVFGVPSIIAVIMNYVRKSDVRGTFLESHFAWQIRTFWFTLLWTIVAAIISAPLVLVLVGLVTFPAAVVVIGIWVAYRVIRGWLALRDGRTVGSP